MIRYFLTRLGYAMITMLLVAIVVFVGVRLLPGDPAVIMAGDNLDPAVIAALREQYGLDQPWYIQLFAYLKSVVSGDFGTSLNTGLPVSVMVLQSFGVTMQLAVLTLLFGTLIGVLGGVISSYWQGKWPEWVVNIAALIGLSVPNFWLAILMIMYVVSVITWLPASGYVSPSENPMETLRYLIVPALVLSTSFAAIIMRQSRSNMIDALHSDYVLAARTKGVGELAVVVKHALRNSIVVVVTLIGLHLGALISGAAVIEQIFGLPGMGRLAVNSVFMRDYPVIQAVVLVTALAYVLINLVVDLLYSIIDPKIRVGGK